MISPFPRSARIFGIAVLAVCAGLAPAAAADGPTLLGAYRDWSAYQNGSGDSRVCYALSQPKSTSPKNVNRDPVFFLVSDWPARKAKGVRVIGFEQGTAVFEVEPGSYHFASSLPAESAR